MIRLFSFNRKDRLRPAGASAPEAHEPPAQSVKIRFLRIAFPDPVLKYFSSSLAFLSIPTATYAAISSGLYAFVDCISPLLCSNSLRCRVVGRTNVDEVSCQAPEDVYIPSEHVLARVNKTACKTKSRVAGRSFVNFAPSELRQPDGALA